MSSTTGSQLTALAEIISQGVQTLESAYSNKRISFPSLDEPFKTGLLDDDPDTVNTTRLVVAAAYQLVATVRPPMETIIEYGSAMYMPACLGVVDEVDIVDALREAGPQVRERSVPPDEPSQCNPFSFLGSARKRNRCKNWSRL